MRTPLRTSPPRRLPPDLRDGEVLRVLHEAASTAGTPGEVQISASALARRLGVHAATVRRSLSRLSSSGAVAITHMTHDDGGAAPPLIRILDAESDHQDALGLDLTGVES